MRTTSPGPLALLLVALAGCSGGATTVAPTDAGEVCGSVATLCCGGVACDNGLTCTAGVCLGTRQLPPVPDADHLQDATVAVDAPAACTNGAIRCEGEQPETCSSGSWQPLGSSCANLPGLSCVGGVCLDCTGGTRGCLDGGSGSGSGSSSSSADGSASGASSSTSGSSGSTTGSSGSSGSGTGDGGAHSSSSSTGPACPYASTDTVDHDGDGWSNAEGDCNDCNRFINPGAYDIPGNGIDEDCDGTADDEPTGCDESLTAVATTVGTDGAKAMDLCRTAQASPPLPTRTWGVVSAEYVPPDGTTVTAASVANFELGFGILGPTFGTSNSTRHGAHMLGISSGTARQPTDPGYQNVSGFDKGYTSGAPSGFPGQTPACGTLTFGAPHDGAALSLVIRIPTNAVTMSFDSNLFSYEFPDWVCSVYNDTYVVIMTPPIASEPATANDNVAFDPSGNSISIDSSFLRVCDPTTTAGMSGAGPMAGAYAYPCAEGPSKLLGTGFGVDTTGDIDHASTDWLTTTVSVAALQGKQVALLFAVWDSTDGVLDTTVLIDNFSWTFATAPNTVLPAPVVPVTTED